MTQYFEDWRDANSSSVPAAPALWTHRLSSSGYLVDSGPRMYRNVISLGRLMLSRDTADAADADVIILGKSTATGVNLSAACRGSGSSTSNATMYLAYLNGTDYDFVLTKYVAGTLSAIATLDNVKGIVPTDFHCIRLKAQGTALKAKFWKPDELEPALWDIEAVDSSISASGWSGIFSTNTGTYQVKWVSIGTGLDNAPPTSYGVIGTVKDHLDNPLGRTVRAFDRATGRLVAEGQSDDTTGEFLLVAPTAEELTVIAYDADAGDKNALIFDRVVGVLA